MAAWHSSAECSAFGSFMMWSAASRKGVQAFGRQAEGSGWKPAALGQTRCW
jgi:hypothetical protein